MDPHGGPLALVRLARGAVVSTALVAAWLILTGPSAEEVGITIGHRLGLIPMAQEVCSVE